MKEKVALIIVLIGFSYIQCHAQKEISDQSHAWLMYFGNHKINDRWGLHTEYQWRRAEFMDAWQQSLLRLGVDYYAKNGSQYTMGYGWIESFVYGDQPITRKFNEHRIWEQFITKSKVARVEIQHRYRLEQRWLENWMKSSDKIDSLGGFIHKNRARYRFMANIPLNKKEMSDNTFFLSLYDELFIGFGPNIAKNVLDQNRMYAALGYRFNAKLSIQLGYLNQYIIKTDGIKAERNHTLQTAIFYHLDFRKPEADARSN